VFGRHQCAYQTLRCAFTSDNPSPPLTDPSQEIKDVKEKLEDLVRWLVKLKGSLMNTNTDDDQEEAERRAQLEKFASCIWLSRP
jgi:hypothetical protein